MIDEPTIDPTPCPPPDPGGPCVICGERITHFDSYGVGKVPGARYHWHCVRAEAETVSPKATMLPLYAHSPDCDTQDTHPGIFAVKPCNCYVGVIQALTSERDSLQQLINDCYFHLRHAKDCQTKDESPGPCDCGMPAVAMRCSAVIRNIKRV